MNPISLIQRINRSFPRAKHLLRPDWRKINEKSGIDSTGFCYIATEALFHLIGGIDSGYKPMCASTSEGTHWWLQKDKEILDPTASQYKNNPPPYHLGRRCGFLTGYKKPSKKTLELIEIINQMKTQTPTDEVYQILKDLGKRKFVVNHDHKMPIEVSLRISQNGIFLDFSDYESEIGLTAELEVKSLK